MKQFNGTKIIFKYDENTEYATNKFVYFKTTKRLLIYTLEGTMEVSKNDYIIKGIKGEFYPCKPDIFEESYDMVEYE